jgi:hypothetical protein
MISTHFQINYGRDTREDSKSIEQKATDLVTVYLVENQNTQAQFLHDITKMALKF